MANLLEEARNLMPGRGRSHWSLDEARHPAYSEGSPYMTFLRALHQTVKAGMSQLRGKHEVRLSPADTEFTQHLVVQGFGPKGALPVASRFFIDGTWLAKDKPGSGGHYVQATGARKTWNMKGEDPARLGKHLGAAMLKSLKSRGMGESLDEGVAAGMPKTLRVVKGNKKFGIDKHSTLHVMSIEPFETGAKLIVQGRINKQAGKTALWVRYMKHLKERDTFNLAKGDGINKIVVQVMKRAEGAKTESIVGAAGPFAISDAPAPTPQEQVADLLDRVRSPRWEYPSWALPKVKLDEAGAKWAGTKLKDALPKGAKKVGRLGHYDTYQHGKWLYLVDPTTGEVVNVTQDKR